MTDIVGADDLDRAVAVLRSGGLVAFPTETVYGLGADASVGSAVRRVFIAKGRPAGHPLIVHLASIDALDEWAVGIDPRARALAERFWPGPLTLVLHRSKKTAEETVGGRNTVGLRVPDHALTLSLLDRFGGGMAGPSANRFGHVSPTTARHVHEDLDGRIDLILDGGPAQVGLESTIVEVLDGPVTLLRPGAISVDALAETVGEVIVDGRTGESRAAGMLASHYAPEAAVEVIDRVPTEVGPDTLLIVAGLAGSDSTIDRPELLRLPADAAGFGEKLYAALRDADHRGFARVLIVPPTTGALLPAVLDRLVKAAGPRN